MSVKTRKRVNLVERSLRVSGTGGRGGGVDSDERTVQETRRNHKRRGSS